MLTEHESFECAKHNSMNRLMPLFKLEQTVFQGYVSTFVLQRHFLRMLITFLFLNAPYEMAKCRTESPSILVFKFIFAPCSNMISKVLS